MQMLRSISEADMATRFPTLFRKSLILFAFAATLGGGALVAAPAGTSPSKIAAFSRAIPSRCPKAAIWAGAMVVISCAIIGATCPPMIPAICRMIGMLRMGVSRPESRVSGMTNMNV